MSEVIHLPGGTTVTVLHAGWHGFAAAAGPARVHFVCTPGGLERFFRAVAADPPDEAAIAAAGIEFAPQA